MNIAAEHLAAIESYGYTRTEAAFLYLVATHSGYFTQQQFLRFAGVEKGGSAARFTRKLRALRHGRPLRYGHHTYIYNVYSRRIYGVVGKDNLRNRRRLSDGLICTRLLILDFILEHLDRQYLETEADKVAFFHRQAGLPLAILPGRTYTGIKALSATRRFFVDRFPIFLAPALSCSSPSPVPTFVYCDSGGPGLLGLLSHLRSYQGLLDRLPSFHFIYAAPVAAKFARAGRLFHQMFVPEGQLEVKHLVRYFEVRRLWEDHKTGALTRADRHLLRQGDRRYRTQIFQDAYLQWRAGKLSENHLLLLRNSSNGSRSRQFSTCLLPDRSRLFESTSKEYPCAVGGTFPETACSAGGSRPLSPFVQG